MPSNPMLAMTQTRYGPPRVLSFEKVERPAVAAGEVLLAVRAASLNLADWHLMTGLPYLVRMRGLRPSRPIPGTDLAGTVQAVGSDVTAFTPGDEVCGYSHGGALAEYVSVPQEQLAIKPATVSFEDAATLGVAAMTALQGLRDSGAVAPGKRVLINGASGGVGTFAVQLAVHLGADITGVCSTRNVDQAHRLGATRVLDYASQDVTDDPADSYDVIFDNVGNLDFGDVKRLLAAPGRYVMVTGPKRKWIGPLGRALRGALSLRFTPHTFSMVMASENASDLGVLLELVEKGHVVPAIDRRYALADSIEAMSYLAEGHARGKVIVEV